MRFAPLFTLSTLLLSALFLTSCSDKPQENSEIPSVKFTLEDTTQKEYTVHKQGRTITIDEAKGKVLIFDIFATWCPSCKVIAPHLGHIQEKYGDSVQVLGILIEEGKPHSYAIEFAQKYGATYPISNSEDNRELAGRIAADMRQPRSFPIPLVVMYDQKGEYFRHYVGAVPEEMIERDVATLLGQ
ncbi:MAG: hypothetical protein KU37_10660 [Sulfuricurvum sp. PC08-66]|nr:MAG: hypothetical protein KU37_10660 [Sulfuricurvum sp. PC08-66]